jgi:outer membrane protein assembly factor BamB
VAIAVATAAAAHAADWPMWRHDAARSASSEQQLPDALHLQWSRALPKLDVAWPDQDMMWFDAQYEPIVVGRRMFVGSSQTDSVTAYDTRSGAELWQFRAAGPIRFAPVAFGHKLCVASDDGHLYCLDQADGRVVWRHRGGPTDRKVLGNERLISMWPARGGPVVADGTVYYAAGIWPFMGIFLHALDAETGTVRWTNDGDGSRFMLQPHNTNSFAGVAPQGALVVAGDRLIVPGGRSVPAVYDRRTGKLLHYELAANNKRGGGSAVAAGPGLFYNGGYAFSLEKGDVVDGLKFTVPPVIAGRTAYTVSGDDLAAVESGTELFRFTDGKDRKGQPIKVRKANVETKWKVEIDDLNDLIRAGDKLFGSSDDRIVAVAGLFDAAEPKVVWNTKIDGRPTRIVAADDRLFVVTTDGVIRCFGGDAPAKSQIHFLTVTTGSPDPAAAGRAERLVAATEARDGYAVVWGAGDGALVQALLFKSELNLVVVEPDARYSSARPTRFNFRRISPPRCSAKTRPRRAPNSNRRRSPGCMPRCARTAAPRAYV